jgi:hypothetical protein
MQHTSQCQSQKAYLQSKYPYDKLYKVVESRATQEMLEVSVVEGDVVATIKQQDPMGNSEVWFVDSGGKNWKTIPSAKNHNLSVWLQRSKDFCRPGVCNLCSMRAQSKWRKGHQRTGRLLTRTTTLTM